MGSVYGQIGPQQSIYEASSEQQAAIGTRIQFENGDVFRYCLAGADLAAGKLAQAPATVANHKACTVATSASIRDSKVTITLGATAVSANDYSGGTAHEVVAGATYVIESHPAASASANLELTLRDKLMVAVTAAVSKFTLIANPYYKPIAYAFAQAGVCRPVGVPRVAIASGYYGWLQTWGMASLLVDTGGTTEFYYAIGGDAVEGAVDSIAGTTTRIVGQSIIAGTATQYDPVHLMIDP